MFTYISTSSGVEMTTESSPRERMVRAFVHLLRERRYRDLTLLDIVAQAEVPLHSIYSHSPGGKEALAIEVTTRVGHDLERLAERVAVRTEGPEAFLRALIEQQGERMAGADFAMVCPLTSLSLAATEAPESGPLGTAIADTFSAWMCTLALRLRSKGLEPVAAERVAATITAGIEGAIIVSRATRSTATFSHLSASIPALLAAGAS
jgi:AcrR family transcriptional regulator